MLQFIGIIVFFFISQLIFNKRLEFLFSLLENISSVVQPPPDQQTLTRLGLFYFCMADDNVKLAPLLESPVLQQGLQAGGLNLKRFEGAEEDVVPTMEVWRRGRTAAYGQSDLKPTGEGGVEEEVINGVVVKHYN